MEGFGWPAKNGEMCAIKFDHENNLDALEKEALNWKVIWERSHTQVIQLGKRPALMMPYMKQFTAWNDISQVEVVRNAAKKMVDKGFQHSDLSKRHVAYASPTKKGAAKEVVFLDNRKIDVATTESLQLMLKKLNIE